MQGINITSLVSGMVFIVLGVLFLLDRLGVLALSGDYVWPLLLIGLGIAVIAGGRRRRDRPPERQSTHPERHDDPGAST